MRRAIGREVGERSQPTKRAEFKSAGDMTAVEELLSVGLLRQDLDGRRVEAAGSSVLERLFSKEDFDIEIAELVPATAP
jgi:ribosomal protein S19E (S16A)